MSDVTARPKWRRFLVWGGGGFTLLLAVAAACLYFFGGRMGHASFWESEIEAFEAADAESPPEPGAIVFTGSSSVRFWSTLERDMAPLRVLNRGFGGSHMAHVLYFADRIITPYVPRALVLYVGDNDIGADKSPEVVAKDFQALVAHVRQNQPALPIYFLTIKASRLRWSLWPEMDRANDLIREIAAGDPQIQVIDVSGPMIEAGGGGQPPADLFIFDGLHLSEKGYALWTSIVRERLLADFGPDADAN